MKRDADRLDVWFLVLALVLGGGLMGLYVWRADKPEWPVMAVIAAFMVAMAKGRLFRDLWRIKFGNGK